MGRYWLVLVDACSKYPCIHPTQSTSTKAINELQEEIFSDFGYPQTLATYSTTTFTSARVHNGAPKEKPPIKQVRHIIWLRMGSSPLGTISLAWHYLITCSNTAYVAGSLPWCFFLILQSGIRPEKNRQPMLITSKCL